MHTYEYVNMFELYINALHMYTHICVYIYIYSKCATIVQNFHFSVTIDIVLNILSHELCLLAFEDVLDIGEKFKSFIVKYNIEQIN